MRYLNVVKNGTAEAELYPAFGYENATALANDKFSHCAGFYPCFSLVKWVNGVAQFPPDRVTAYSDWLNYFTQLATLTRDQDPGVWTGIRQVPYKAWNSWADSVAYTKLEEVLADAYNRGNACPYYAVSYETGSHNDISYGEVNDMIPQLIEWYKRWE